MGLTIDQPGMRRFFQSIKSGLSGNQVGRRMEDSFQKVIENNFDVIYEDPKSTLEWEATFFFPTMMEKAVAETLFLG